MSTVQEPTVTTAPSLTRTSRAAVSGLVLAFVFWPAGLVVSSIGLAHTSGKRGSQALTGRGMALAGVILSAVFAVLSVGLLTLLLLLVPASTESPAPAAVEPAASAPAIPAASAAPAPAPEAQQETPAVESIAQEPDAEEVIAAFAAAGLPVRDARDNTDKQCSTYGCAAYWTSEDISVIVFDDAPDAAAFADKGAFASELHADGTVVLSYLAARTPEDLRPQYQDVLAGLVHP